MNRTPSGPGGANARQMNERLILASGTPKHSFRMRPAPAGAVRKTGCLLKRKGRRDFSVPVSL
jgi:hypothetical protein